MSQIFDVNLVYIWWIIVFSTHIFMYIKFIFLIKNGKQIYYLLLNPLFLHFVDIKLPLSLTIGIQCTLEQYG